MVAAVFYSKALGPLLVALPVVIPLLILIGFVHLAARASRRRREATDAERLARRQDVRDQLFLLIGATAGALASRADVNLWAEARLGVLLVLPAGGDALGLIVAALTPPSGLSATTTAALRPREIATYSPGALWRLLWAASLTTLALMVVRWILPPETPIGKWPAGVPRLLLRATPLLFTALAIFALVLCALSKLACRAIVRRSRPARDSEELEIQERLRARSVGRLLGWSAATVLWLDAAMVTAFPPRMGGVVFGDVQLIQRAADALAVGLVIAAGLVVALAYRATSPLSPALD